MKKLLFLILISVLSGSKSIAQFSVIDSVWRTGMFVSIGGQNLDLDNLNRALGQAGIPELRSGLLGFTFGITNRHRDQNSYQTLQLSYFSTFDDGNDAGSDARVDLWKLTATGQYDVIPNEKWLIFPYLQLSSGLARLKVSSITNISSFQGSLNNLNSPDELVKRYSSDLFIVGGIGVGIERRYTFPGTINHIGISAGYEVSPRSEWRTDGANYFLNGSPDFRTNGLVFELRLRVEPDPSTLTDRELQPRGLFKFFQ